MNSPSAVPPRVRSQGVVAAGELWHGSLRAMASRIGVVLGAGSADPHRVLADVADVFTQVEAQCTRFDSGSDLMRANAAAQRWCRVGAYCLAAITEAAHAHQWTAGWFDPRVLRTLTTLGYHRTVPFADGDLELNGSAEPVPATGGHSWHPGLDPAGSRVRVGPDPVDLGGIGKGLAVRWAAEKIASRCPSFLIDAGGDCYLGGNGPDGDGWHVGVEDPRGGTEPVAVLAISDAACATSSIRLRRWHVDGKTVHHLIDPRTGTPGGEGLLSVTVIGADPARAEVRSKVLFLHGIDGIADAAESLGTAALWVAADGSLGSSAAARQFVIWQRS